MIDFKSLDDFKSLIEIAKSIKELNNIKTAKKEKHYNHQIAQITHDEIFKVFLKSHPSDQANIIELCLMQEKNNFVILCLLYIHHLFINHISNRALEKLLKLIGEHDFAEIIIKLDTDDSIAILEDLDIELMLKIIATCPNNYKIKYKKILSYPVESVGRIMDTDFIKVNNNSTAREVIDEIRSIKSHHGTREDATDIVVVNEDDTFYGMITIANVIRLNESDKITKYIDKSPKTLDVKQSKKDAIKIFTEYEYKTIPVVSRFGKVIGVIDDFSVVDYLQDQNEGEFLKSRGVFEDTSKPYSIFKTGLSRSTWLFVNLITAILSSFFISMFESSISKLAPLAVLMPIVASVGGNSGMQTSTVTIRFIATNSIKGIYLRYFFREVFIGFFNCFAFSILGFFIALIWYKNLMLAVAFSISIALVVIAAAVCGFIIPSILNKIKIDPAIASSVFLTTVTDIVGFSGFLFLSKILVL